MARKRCPKAQESGGGEGAPAWMVTYSDMVTLLLTFFVMMMAMANFEDVGRMSTVFESVRTALGADGFNTRALGLDTQPQHQVAEIERPDQLMPVVSRLREALARHVSDDLVRITKTRTELRVALDASVLFAPGSAELHPAAYSLLTEVAGVLAQYPVSVIAEGHTDASGSRSANWRLSALRAAAVIDILQERGGLDGRRLEVRGYGPYRPAGAGEGAFDRRVELVIRADDRGALPVLDGIEDIQGGGDGR